MPLLVVVIVILGVGYEALMLFLSLVVLPTFGGIGRTFLKLEARARARGIDRSPLTDDERARYQSILSEFVDGAPFSMTGGALKKAALARGMVLARSVEQRLRPETSGYDDASREYDAITHQLHGWHGRFGLLRVEWRTSPHLLNGFAAEVGEPLLVVYDRAGPGHFVFAFGDPRLGRVRTAFRAAHGRSDADEDDDVGDGAGKRPPAQEPARSPASGVPASATSVPPTRPAPPATAPRPLRRGTRRPRFQPRPDDIPATLLALIADASADDAPRQVLADRLMEQGDPLGQFIALQLADARQLPDLNRKVKLNVLQRDHGARWCPPGVRSPRFHRGLLQHAEWYAETDPAHPAWLTVESLHCALDRAPRGSVFDFDRPLLRSVTGLSRDLFAHVSDAQPVGLEDLESWIPKEWLLDGLASRLATFSHLRSFEFRTGADGDAGTITAEHLRLLLRQCRRLERLRFSRPPDVPLRVLDRLRCAEAPSLQVELRVTFDWPPGAVEPRVFLLDMASRRLHVPMAGKLGLIHLDFARRLERELGRDVDIVQPAQ